MRSFLADIFRFLFRFPFFRKRFFGIHKRLFLPLNLFRGIKKKISIKEGLLFDLTISDWVQENLFFLGEYEETEIRFVEDRLKPGDVFIDIGANIGLYSLIASRAVGDKGKVFSFEPLQLNFDSLCQNVSLNKQENITLSKLAVSDKKGELEIYYDTTGMNLGMASFYQTAYSRSEKVDSITIDHFIDENSIEKVDFIKIDIEGSEFPALMGMKKTLSRFKPVLLLEINEEVLIRTPHRAKDLIEFLKKFDYEKHPVDDDPEKKNFAFIKKPIVIKQPSGK